MAWQFRIDRGGTFSSVVARDPQAAMRTTAPQSDTLDAYGLAVVAGICRSMRAR
jgi:N-methylhydantoinase A/oxoprolinase/acetone carboxylase beta subunit